MTMQAQPRSVLQFLTGAKRGLLCQVLAVEGDVLRCLSRDFVGEPHFFDVPIGDSYRVVGEAILGPKPKDQSSQPALPPPLNPQEFLEPLPADVKAAPMSEADIPPAVPLPPEAKRIRGPKRRIQPIFVQDAEPPKPPKPPVKKVMHTATVTNGLGDQAVVTIGVPENRKPIQCNGIAVMLAGKLIPNSKPFTVSDWTMVKNAP